jgi:hypothetical protein
VFGVFGLEGRKQVKVFIKCHFGSMVGSMVGVAVRAFASHQCGPGSIPGIGITCEMSYLLVLFLASRGFLQGLWFSSLHKNKYFKIVIGLMYSFIHSYIHSIVLTMFLVLYHGFVDQDYKQSQHHLCLSEWLASKLRTCKIMKVISIKTRKKPSSLLRVH